MAAGTWGKEISRVTHGRETLGHEEQGSVESRNQCMKKVLKILMGKIPDSISAWFLLIVVMIMIFFKYYSEAKQKTFFDYSKNHAGEADLYQPYGSGSDGPNYYTRE